MCGIFGVISNKKIYQNHLKILADNARQRGKDSSGFIEYDGNAYKISRFDLDLKKTIKKSNPESKIILGHSRLVTNSMIDNQPLLKHNICVIHNGIITNFQKLYEEYEFRQNLKSDTEIIADLINYYLKKNINLNFVIKSTLAKIQGSASCVVQLLDKGKIILFSNNGSLYYGKKNNCIYISSEFFSLNKVNCEDIKQIHDPVVLNVPVLKHKIKVTDTKVARKNLVPEITRYSENESLLIYKYNQTKRCNKCILPYNFPYISFDNKGVCNFCNNYEKKYKNFNHNRHWDFKELLKKYLDNKNEIKCIFPLSGGRDSCYGLHLIVKEMGIKPVTFTYDWGLVTDLARRNISRISSILNVENIIVADNIKKKKILYKKKCYRVVKKTTSWNG